MLKNLVIPAIVLSAVLVGSGPAWSQVSSTDLSKVQGQLADIGTQVSLLQRQVSQIAQKPPQTHTVRNGETAWGISRKYRVKFDDLIKVNRLSSTNPVLRIGQKLKIPGVAPKTTPKTSTKKPVSYRSHKVARNETLSKIGRKYGVSLAALRSANNLANPNMLYVGQTIRVPVYGTSKTPSTKAAPPQKKKSTSTRKTPSPGQVAAPAKGKRVSPPRDRAGKAPAGYGLYVAQPGDTTASIAKTYGLTVSELLRINRRSSTPRYQPRPGDMLIVPTDGTWYVPTKTGNTTTRKPASSSQSRSSSGSRSSLLVHEVAPNDSLEELAKKFNTTVEQITINNPGVRSNNDLKVGTALKIPARS